MRRRPTPGCRVSFRGLLKGRRARGQQKVHETDRVLDPSERLHCWQANSYFGDAEAFCFYAVTILLLVC